MLDLHNPTLDWVKLAKGTGVETVRVEDTRGFAAALRSAVDAKGCLIEALDREVRHLGLLVHRCTTPCTHKSCGGSDHARLMSAMPR
jgi:hypothetical protein